MTRAAKGEREADVQQAIRLALGLEPGLVLFRNQVGQAVFEGNGTRYTVPYGVGGKGGSDLIGLLTIDIGGRQFAQWVALEVKTQTGNPTPEQLDFIHLIRNAGGFACIVRSVDESRAAIARAREGARE